MSFCPLAPHVPAPGWPRGTRPLPALGRGPCAPARACAPWRGHARPPLHAPTYMCAITGAVVVALGVGACLCLAVGLCVGAAVGALWGALAAVGAAGVCAGAVRAWMWRAARRHRSGGDT